MNRNCALIIIVRRI